MKLREVNDAKRRETESVCEHQTNQRENSAGESREQRCGEHLRWSEPTRRGGEQLDIARAEHAKRVEGNPEGEPEHAAAEAARDEVRVFVIFWDEYHIGRFAEAIKGRRALSSFVS